MTLAAIQSAPVVRPIVPDVDRQALLEEVRLEIELYIQGIALDPDELAAFHIGHQISEQRHLLFDMNRRHRPDIELPESFFLPHGGWSRFRWDPDSRYRLRAVDGQPVVFRDDKPLTPITFFERPAVNDGVTSDGTPFGKFAQFYHEGSVHFFYSNECALKDTGDDCKFCNINSTARAHQGKNLFFKNPRQIGDVYAAAYEAGFGNYLRLTGGFIPERREVEYYLDVADELKERTGQDALHGLTVIGAPHDLTLIDKYKEAGWSNLSINIEIWDKRIFEAICPGKSRRFGGWDHWVKALGYAAQVFGKGQVRSSIVAGIEPKASTLEGVEHLASLGVIAFPGAWIPNPGSELEGHRTPEADWHFDLAQKTAAIHAKYGFTTHQLYACAGWQCPFIDIFRINAGEVVDGRLPRWTFPDRRRSR